MKILRLTVLLGCLIFSSVPKGFSVECDPMDLFSDCGTGEDHDDYIPLDDGVIFLIAAGAIFAVREHRKRTAATALTDIN